MAIGIIGTGSYLPTSVVTNHDLERQAATPDHWISPRTGIRARRRAAAGPPSPDLGTLAAERALQGARLAPEQIDGLVVATSSPDYVQPATACSVQAKLGLAAGPA